MRRDEIADLTAFVVVAKERSFTKAAARLGMAQSAISQIVRRTDDAGALVGIHRTWLDASGRGKALVESPSRSMGAILGHGVRLS